MNSAAQYSTVQHVTMNARCAIQHCRVGTYDSAMTTCAPHPTPLFNGGGGNPTPLFNGGGETRGELANRTSGVASGTRGARGEIVGGSKRELPCWSQSLLLLFVAAERERRVRLWVRSMTSHLDARSPSITSPSHPRENPSVFCCCVNSNHQENTYVVPAPQRDSKTPLVESLLLCFAAERESDGYDV